MAHETRRDWPAVRVTADGQSPIVDRVAVEHPVVIKLNGTEVATLLCTPTDLDALAMGYLAGERYIVNVRDVKTIEVCDDRSSVTVTASSRDGGARPEPAVHVVTSGCGSGRLAGDLLGLAAAWRLGEGIRVSARDIRRWMKEFAVRSTLFHETGGVHSAAVCLDSRVAAFSEDIGRHNAIDKVLGRAMLDRVPLDSAVVLTSGRISAEVVLKCGLRQVGIVVSRGAATNLAIDLADRMRVTVAGFTRGRRMTVYTHDERIVP